MSAPFRIVLPASADRAPWLAARRDGIGSSDVAAILGVSTWGTAQHVYYDKTGQLPLEDRDAGEAALWGSLDEDTTAREWARRNRSVVRRIGLIARRDQPWQMCTLDRQVRECPLSRDRSQFEVCALEVKHRNAFVAGKWKRSIPDDVLAQVLWQIHVTGYDHIHVACRIGGIDYRQYVIRRKEYAELLGDIVAAVARFWTEQVLARCVPPLTGQEPADRMLDLFEELHPDRGGVARLDGRQRDEAADALAEYERQRLIAARAKREQGAAKTRLLELLGGAEAAAFTDQPEIAYGWLAASIRTGDPYGTTVVDLERLAEEFPDAYAACVTTKPQRRLTIDRRYRLTEEDIDDLVA